MRQDIGPSFFVPWCDLGKPNQNFHCFDLAEERTLILEMMSPPMTKQTSSLRSYTPLRFRKLPPSCHCLSDTIDPGISFILLGIAFILDYIIEFELLLFKGILFCRFFDSGNRRDV